MLFVIQANTIITYDFIFQGLNIFPEFGPTNLLTDALLAQIFTHSDNIDIYTNSWAGIQPFYSSEIRPLTNMAMKTNSENVNIYLIALLFVV